MGRVGAVSESRGRDWGGWLRTHVELLATRFNGLKAPQVERAIRLEVQPWIIGVRDLAVGVT